MSKFYILVGSLLIIGLFNVSAQTTLYNATSHPNLWTSAHSTSNSSLVGNFPGTGTPLGDAWGLYANSLQTSAMTFNFGQSLQVDGYIEIAISLGFNDGGIVGFSLQDNLGTNRFESYYIGNHGSDTFKLNDAGGQDDITGPNTSFNASSWKAAVPEFQTIRFTLSPANSYQLSFDGVNVTNTGLTIAASDISQIRIFNYNAGSTSDHNQYFDNLVISIPEPSAVSLLGLTGLLALRRARKDQPKT